MLLGNNAVYYEHCMKPVHFWSKLPRFLMCVKADGIYIITTVSLTL